MSETTKPPPVTIRIPPDLLAALRERAAQEDRTLTSLAIHLMRQAMAGWNT